MTHVTCRLTAKNRDQLRNPTLGNRVWATFLRLTYGKSVRQINVRVRYLHVYVHLKNNVLTAVTLKLRLLLPVQSISWRIIFVGEMTYFVLSKT